MEDNNALEFVVRSTASKKTIKNAIETLFDVEVDNVNTKIAKDGKHAIVRFSPDYDAEDIGMRIGVF